MSAEATRGAAKSQAAPLPVPNPDLVRAAYDHFADVYDRYWGDVMTEPVLALVARHIEGEGRGQSSEGGALLSADRKSQGRLEEAPAADSTPAHAERPLRLLDLCCGSGQLAAALSERGHVVVGVDASTRLLGHARRRAPRASFLAQDMRDLRLDRPVDGAICAFDSLNHLPDESALERVFERVHGCLSPGGTFLFDLNTDTGFLERFTEDFAITTEEIVLTVRGDYDGRIGRYRITWLAPSSADPELWRRHDVTLRQRCFALPEVRRLLAKVGFQGIRTLDAESEVGMDGHVGRVFFLAQRR